MVMVVFFSKTGSHPLTDPTSVSVLALKGAILGVNILQPGYYRLVPGTNLTGRVIFEVESRASGFRLQLGDGRQFPQENGYVDLGS